MVQTTSLWKNLALRNGLRVAGALALKLAVPLLLALMLSFLSGHHAAWAQDATGSVAGNAADNVAAAPGPAAAVGDAVAPTTAATESAIDLGDTSWMLMSAALVLLMTPGLSLFYGGLVRGKNMLNTMLMSFGAMALVGVLWIFFGYSFAFGDGGPANALFRRI